MLLISGNVFNLMFNWKVINLKNFNDNNGTNGAFNNFQYNNLSLGLADVTVKIPNFNISVSLSTFNKNASFGFPIIPLILLICDSPNCGIFTLINLCPFLILLFGSNSKSSFVLSYNNVFDISPNHVHLVIHGYYA